MPHRQSMDSLLDARKPQVHGSINYSGRIAFRTDARDASQARICLLNSVINGFLHNLQVSSAECRGLSQEGEHTLLVMTAMTGCCDLPAIQLHALIVNTVSSAIQNEPSEVQKDRVRKFQAAEKAKMLVEKKKRKGVKSGRGRVHFDD
jgi:hypothetical protein